MKKLRFEKWEGLGNDFVVIDESDLPRVPSDDDVRAICDRRRGVGADGILIVGRSPGVDGTMIVRNADGSRPEMCGNGIRCVAAYLNGGKARNASLVLRTDSGDLGCEIEMLDDGRAEVNVAMGRARFEGSLDVRVPAEGDSTHRFALVNMGNPHAVTFEPYEDGAIDRIAPVVEKARTGNVNVEFVRPEGSVLVVRVWERGVGYTEACGTGACAVAAIACRIGVARFDEATAVRLPGGTLQIRVAEATLDVEMRGPARRVFRGETTLGD